MKLSSAFLVTFLANSVLAFAPSTSSSQKRLAPLYVQSQDLKGYYTASYSDEQIKEMIPPDYGFDPLGFSETNAGLFFMREAEIKHARLAMLAAAGWYVSISLTTEI